MEAEALKAFFTLINNMGVLPVYWPNVNVENPDSSHLRVTVFPVSPELLTTQGKTKNEWILQVSIYVRTGIGSIVPAQYADTIKAGIPFNTVLQSDNYKFQTTRTGAALPLVDSSDKAWSFMPIQFRFISFN